MRTTPESSRTLRENLTISKKGKESEKDKKRKGKKLKLKQQILDESDHNFFDDGETSFSEEDEDDTFFLI